MHSTLRTGVAVAALALIPATEAAAASYGSRALRMGASGSDVKYLQRYLDTAGYETTADGEFGPATARSMRAFEAAEDRRRNATATRYEQHLVRVRADAADVEEAPAPATEEAYIGEDGLAVAPASAPEEVKAIIAAGNEIATKPYRYGGGHGKWRDTGYDCSGSVSYALHAGGLLQSPLVSGDFARWGVRGPGRWITIYGNSGHVYMVVAGMRFDTSARSRTGSRWTRQGRRSDGYAVVHPK